MPMSPFNASHASVDPRGLLIRDHLAEAGEAHGRVTMDLAIERVPVVNDATAVAVVALIDAEGIRMARLYAEAGCSRRQLRAFCDAFVRGSAARAQEAAALAATDHRGSA